MDRQMTLLERLKLAVKTNECFDRRTMFAFADAGCDAKNLRVNSPEDDAVICDLMNQLAYRFDKLGSDCLKQ
jgi:hypothetical protein